MAAKPQTFAFLATLLLAFGACTGEDIALQPPPPTASGKSEDVVVRGSLEQRIHVGSHMQEVGFVDPASQRSWHVQIKETNCPDFFAVSLRGGAVRSSRAANHEDRVCRATLVLRPTPLSTVERQKELQVSIDHEPEIAIEGERFQVVSPGATISPLKISAHDIDGEPTTLTLVEKSCPGLFLLENGILSSKPRGPEHISCEAVVEASSGKTKASRTVVRVQDLFEGSGFSLTHVFPGQMVGFVFMKPHLPSPREISFSEIPANAVLAIDRNVTELFGWFSIVVNEYEFVIPDGDGILRFPVPSQHEYQVSFSTKFNQEKETEILSTQRAMVRSVFIGDKQVF